ncbi:MAG: hypothetical protein R3A44_25945 [Caldilineaceae bacterium]
MLESKNAKHVEGQMKNQRRQYNGQFKFRVALEALGEDNDQRNRQSL